MSGKPVEDLRVRKTKTAIRKVFADMLLDMPFEKITVKALCERALVNKTTFYRHYGAIEDLLEELQREYARPYVEQTAGLRYPQDIEQIVRVFMYYSAEQGPLYDAILTSSVYTGIMTKIMDEMAEERDRDYHVPKGWTDEEWLLYLTHVNSSQIRIYKRWVESGRSIPLERMVDLAVSLICDGARLIK